MPNLTSTAITHFPAEAGIPPPRRSIGTARLKHFDPFVMLDEFKVATPAGFPDHPHRGMTTVTYVLPNAGNGCMEHEDSVGSR